MDEKWKHYGDAPLQLDLDRLGLGGLLQGLGKLIEMAQTLERAGGEIRRTGTVEIKGVDDLRGVFGFSVRTGIGRDGRRRPIVRPFGNISRTRRGVVLNDVREPLIDLYQEPYVVRVVAEIPGVEENEIRYELNGSVLILHTRGERKFSREILLPCPVDAERLQRHYRNGVLELIIPKKPMKSRGGS